MKKIGIEQTLLEYHKVTGKDWKFTAELVESFPDMGVSEVRAVCINSVHIKFYEKMDIEGKSSIVFWMLDADKR